MYSKISNILLMLLLRKFRGLFVLFETKASKTMTCTLRRKMAGQEIEEAVPGWCEVEGCNEKFMQFMIAGRLS
jgi:hypothetical protein